jgi:small subunit ribosomal protein S1
MNGQPLQKKKYTNVMPETDEGWWESVLAEEEQYQHAARQQATAKLSPVVDVQVGKKAETEAPPMPHVDWDAARKFYADDSILEIKVTGHNHGGLLVEKADLAGFVPFSHLVDLAGTEHDTDRDRCLDAYVGKTLKVKVIECVPEDGRVVLSERAALTPPGKRTELFHALHVGSQVVGKVTNITDFGVFVDLGGAEGLIHLSELSWGRVLHPRTIVSVGEEIKVQVLEISVERNRVALSLKRMIPNPWERATVDFPVGRILQAVVTSVLSYGAFARIEAGVEGLIHATEMSLAENRSPRDVLKDGQNLQVRVLHVDPAHQRLGLSLRLGDE